MKTTSQDITEAFTIDIKKRSDRLMNYFLPAFFAAGLVLAIFYGTWLIAIAAGGLSLLAFYSVKWLLPDSDTYQYVLAVVLGIFMAQFIYQMHGLFEMHFFAFIGSAILITYQKWKLQIPLMIVVLIHHAGLGYLQNMGYEHVYFTQLDTLTLQTFIIHIILAAIIFYTCGLWAYQLKKYGEIQISQTVENERLHKETMLLSERKKSQDALEIAYERAEKARQEAEQANQAKSIFLATMSHEIRTPMNGVIGMASLLAETALTEQQRMYTSSITTCGESLLNVINDILDFSKIESGNMELEQEEFELRNCIEDVLDIFGPKASKQGLELIYQIGADIPWQIIGDDLRLRQILTNLVGNAIKFTSAGEVFIKVERSTLVADKDIILNFSVQDTGIGIPEDKVKKLFKAFSQVDSSTTRKYGGTGLGLVISEKLVRLMGGNISVYSDPGKGSCFSFDLKTRAGNRILTPLNQHSMADHEGKRVLVVDDNLTNRAILKSQLENWKLSPVLAASGSEALNILKSGQNFDLVLTDMQMPAMDGATLAADIGTAYPQIPIILLSSIGDELNKEYRRLFYSILNKPVKQLVLGKYILAALNNNQKILTEERTENKKLPADFSIAHPMTILIAEDNLINQQVILHILKNMGYEPVMVENGLEALEINSREFFDLILMDMQMPEMDGLEATRRIRKSSGRQPVIFALTANTMEGDQEECLKAGMNDYISKPIRLENLMEKIVKWSPRSMDMYGTATG